VAHPLESSAHHQRCDGFRVIAWKQGERVALWSRRGADLTGRFASIAQAVRRVAADEALIDGEAVVFRDDGRSDLLALLTEAVSKRYENLPPAARRKTFRIFSASARAQGSKKRTKRERVKTCARFHTGWTKRGQAHAGERDKRTLLLHPRPKCPRSPRRWR
jgi:hypothetical protein